jgi:hypothetical protein
MATGLYSTDWRRMKRKNILQNLGYDTHPLLTDADAAEWAYKYIVCASRSA